MFSYHSYFTMNIYIELRPKLKVGHVVISFEDGFEMEAGEQELMVIKDRVITIAKYAVNCGDIIFKDKSFCLGPLEQQGSLSATSFRLELDDGLNTSTGSNLQLLSKPLIFPRPRLKVEPPDLELDKTYIIQCSACLANLARFSVGRILPQPSSNWQQRTKDWFCCINKLDTPPPITLRPSDVLFGSSGVCVFDKSIFHDKRIEVTNNVLKCVDCSQEIGRRTYTEDSVEVWSYPVVLTREGTEEEQKKIYLNTNVKSAFDNFRLLVLSLVDQNIQIMPKFAFSTAAEVTQQPNNVLLVWVVDKQLDIATISAAVKHQDSETPTIQLRKVVKVLFKETPNRPTEYELVTVSHDIFKSACHTLPKVCHDFPASAKFVNDFQVCYINHM